MKHKVAVVKCNKYDSKLVAKALADALKLIDFEIKPGIKVLIKPNVLSPQKPEAAVTTHPIVLEELCKILKQKNCDIIIGDSAASDTEQSLKVSGITKLAKYGKVINLEGENKRFFDLGKKELNKVPFPKVLFDVDLVIDFAKLKTHILTNVTLCVKNLYGCVPGNLKEQYHKVLPDAKHFSRFLMKIHNTIKPQLNLIDGVLGLEGNGPGASGVPIKSGLIFAGTDARAVDIIASEKMGFKYGEVYTNKFSGIKRRQIEVLGNGKDKNFKFEKANALYFPFFRYLIKFFGKPKICFDNVKCIKCGLCARKCPAKAIRLNPYPECNHKKCIRCLCCMEICPQDAICLKDPPLRNFVKNLIK